MKDIPPAERDQRRLGCLQSQRKNEPVDRNVADTREDADDPVPEVTDHVGEKRDHRGEEIACDRRESKQSTFLRDGPVSSQAAADADSGGVGRSRSDRNEKPVEIIMACAAGRISSGEMGRTQGTRMPSVRPM